MQVLREGAVDVVSGRKITRTDGVALRSDAEAHARVVVDLGAGDGRWIHRTARAHPEWFCIAVDANAGGMREASFRAGRKPARGGAPNARFVRAAVEALPGPLARLADEIHVQYPWGSLLRAVLAPDRGVLAKIARVGKPGGRLSVRINASILRDGAAAGAIGVPAFALDAGALAAAYRPAGIELRGVRWEDEAGATTWGRRLGRGRAPEALILEGRIAGPGSR